MYAMGQRREQTFEHIFNRISHFDSRRLTLAVERSTVRTVQWGVELIRAMLLSFIWSICIVGFSVLCFCGIGKYYFENGLGQYYPVYTNNWCEICKHIFATTFVVGCCMLEIFTFDILGYLDKSLRSHCWILCLLMIGILLNVVVPWALAWAAGRRLARHGPLSYLLPVLTVVGWQVAVWLVGEYLPLRSNTKSPQLFVQFLWQWSLQENIIRLAALGTCVAAMLSAFAAVNFPLDLYLLSKYAEEVTAQDLEDGEKHLLETLLMVESRKQRLDSGSCNGVGMGAASRDWRVAGSELRYTRRSQQALLQTAPPASSAEVELKLLEQLRDGLRNDMAILRRFQEQAYRESTMFGRCLLLPILSLAFLIFCRRHLICALLQHSLTIPGLCVCGANRVEKVSGLALTLWGIFRVCLGVVRVFLRVVVVTGGRIVFYRTQRNEMTVESFVPALNYSAGHLDSMSADSGLNSQRNLVGEELLFDSTMQLLQTASSGSVVDEAAQMELAQFDAYLWSWVPVVYVVTVAVLVVLQIRGFLQSVQQLAKLGFIFSGTDVYSLILAQITGCYFLACLLLLRVTSQQILAAIPSIHSHPGLGPSAALNLGNSTAGISDAAVENVFAHSAQEGARAMLSAFGEDINFDFLFWLFDACFVTSTVFFAVYLWADFHHKKSSIYSFMKSCNLTAGKRGSDRFTRTLPSRHSPASISSTMAALGLSRRPPGGWYNTLWRSVRMAVDKLRRVWRRLLSDSNLQVHGADEEVRGADQDVLFSSGRPGRVRCRSRDMSYSLGGAADGWGADMEDCDDNISCDYDKV